jgi:hypothetical protein
MEETVCLPPLKSCLGVCLEGLRRITKPIDQGSRSLNQDLLTAPPEYEADLLPTWPQCSTKKQKREERRKKKREGEERKKLRSERRNKLRHRQQGYIISLLLFFQNWES